MIRTALLLAPALLLGACSPERPRPVVAAPIPAELAARHDFSLADTPNKRVALAYLYTAWNDARLADARLTCWTPGSWPELESGGTTSGPPGPSPHYTVHQLIEEGDRVVVLAFVRGIGIGNPITTVFGTPGGTKIGDAVVEVFRFGPDGLIQQKWDIIEPVSETSYDFR